jgi:hypothetical protein
MSSLSLQVFSNKWSQVTKVVGRQIQSDVPYSPFLPESSQRWAARRKGTRDLGDRWVQFSY